MSLIRYGFNNKLPLIQAKQLAKKKVTTETSAPSGAVEVSCTSGASGVSGVSGASGASGISDSNAMPKELNELLAKYQEEGCTKEEILNVLDKLKLTSTINGNKVVFEYDGKTYTLTVTVEKASESRTSTVASSTVTDNDISADKIQENTNNTEVDKESKLDEINEKLLTIDLELEELEKMLDVIKKNLENPGSLFALKILTMEKSRIEQQILQLLGEKLLLQTEQSKIESQLIQEEKYLSKKDEIDAELDEILAQRKDYLNKIDDLGNQMYELSKNKPQEKDYQVIKDEKAFNDAVNSTEVWQVLFDYANRKIDYFEYREKLHNFGFVTFPTSKDGVLNLLGNYTADNIKQYFSVLDNDSYNQAMNEFYEKYNSLAHERNEYQTKYDNMFDSICENREKLFKLNEKYGSDTVSAANKKELKLLQEKTDNLLSEVNKLIYDENYDPFDANNEITIKLSQLRDEIQSLFNNCVDESDMLMKTFEKLGVGEQKSHDYIDANWDSIACVYNYDYVVYDDSVYGQQVIFNNEKMNIINSALEQLETIFKESHDGFSLG